MASITITPRQRDKLRRYTDVISALDTLQNKRLVLLSPKLWDDKNDSFYSEQYVRRSAYQSMMALCLTAESETYHHWKIFAEKTGVCIILHKRRFIEHCQTAGLECRPVVYRTNPAMTEKIIHDDIGDLPYLKRYAFRHEKEYRVIYGSIWADQKTQDLSLPISLIHRIVVNPWTPQDLYVSFKELVQRIPGCEKVKVHRSLLTDNETWKDALYLRQNDDVQAL